MEQNRGNEGFQYTQQPATNAPDSPSEPDAETAQQTTQTPLQAAEQPLETAEAPQSSRPLLQWKASEFIDHQKSASWFFPLAGVGIVLAVVVYLLTKDILSTVVVVLAAVAFGVFAHQKPRTLTYTVLPTSLKIGEKTYSYDDFRTFSVLQDGALYSILLEPIKRFIPPLTIYFPPEDGEKIFDVLAAHIPHQERQIDPIDRFMRKIRF